MAHTEKDKGRVSASDYTLLAVAVFIFSCSSLCSKMASGYPIFTWEFVLFYGGSILVLMIYAVLWQMVLKRFPLSTAYASKPVTTLLSMIWGVVLFHEPVSWNMILGAAIILCGIRLAVTDHGE